MSPRLFAKLPLATQEAHLKTADGYLKSFQ